MTLAVGRGWTGGPIVAFVLLAVFFVSDFMGAGPSPSALAAADAGADRKGSAAMRRDPSLRTGQGGRKMKAAVSRREAVTFVQTLDHAPFPYSGKHEDTEVDFFDVVEPESGRRFHTNRYGDRLAEDEHYLDGRVLFHVPKTFDPRKPFAYALFFHELWTDVLTSVEEHELIRQVDASGSNVILVAPQLAKNAPDSSPGKFFRENAFRRFMAEVANVAASRLGWAHKRAFDSAPVLLTAFSGGYRSVAYILDRGGIHQRVKGVFLMDAFYDEVDKFERWAVKGIRRAFLVSLTTPGSCDENMKELRNRLALRGIPSKTEWPERLGRGEVYHVRVDTPHRDVPLLGPPKDPFEALLRLGAR